MTSLSSRFELRLIVGACAVLALGQAVVLGAGFVLPAVPVLGAGIVLAVVTCGVAVWAIRQHKRETDELVICVDAVDAAALGDLNVRIVGLQSAEGNIGRLVKGVNRLLDLSEAFTKEANTAMQYANKRKYFRKIIPTGLRGSFLHYAKTINDSLELMERRDEEFLTFVNQNVVSIANSVSGAAVTLTHNADEMAGLSEGAARESVVAADGARQASSNVEAVAAAVEEYSASIAEITQQVQNVAGMSQNAVVSMQSADQAVSTLIEAAGNIGSVVEFIDEVAGKTNLLALNATIEASRAGEAGKGFAVVAAEVKTLAHQTAEATVSINDQIRRVQEVVEEASNAMRQVGETVQQIENASSTVASAVEEQKAVTQEIARNVTETTSAAQRVSEAIASVDQSTRKASESTETVSVAASELSNNAEALNGQISEFLARMGKAA